MEAYQQIFEKQLPGLGGHRPRSCACGKGGAGETSLHGFPEPRTLNPEPAPNFPK